MLSFIYPVIPYLICLIIPITIYPIKPSSLYLIRRITIIIYHDYFTGAINVFLNGVNVIKHVLITITIITIYFIVIKYLS